ncbi:metalloregulator ArsR/SmtB family transcription factor [Heliobacterium undosum]|uniref:Metalloregulator ArsR/SmtB family transcription factor n=1 Tax=Heliomicrobium undosum TaxID=121734 RepID=A0A845L301_9FIRM|nr:metalloregulator ArsR/SmtB family transcription factor [Heliomicrobium undosum]MZP29224.1 metalloregulator ArsR/SmtB family transcription factor [Heliomicrobium undosum]
MLPLYLKVMKALGDTSRVRILKMLEHKGELCVCDMINVLALSQPTVSNHLALLKEADLLKDRKEGRWVYYSLNRSANVYGKTLLGQLQEWMNDEPVFIEDRRRLDQMDDSGCALDEEKR